MDPTLSEGMRWEMQNACTSKNLRSWLVGISGESSRCSLSGLETLDHTGILNLELWLWAFGVLLQDFDIQQHFRPFILYHLTCHAKL